MLQTIVSVSLLTIAVVAVVAIRHQAIGRRKQERKAYLRRRVGVRERRY